MRVLILGGDGYLGWPTSMHFAARGDEVCVIDNYLRRRIAMETNSEPLVDVPNLVERSKIYEELSGNKIKTVVGDCGDYSLLTEVLNSFSPDVLIHYAEQPSAPYSMTDYRSARLTFENNLVATFNVIWAVMELCSNCHIIKLGTMGEYGIPNIDIEEGWIDIHHKEGVTGFCFHARQQALPQLRCLIQIYSFYVRTHGLRVTDLMQGPVYGQRTNEADLDTRLAPFFNYDDIFGTVVNRFVTQQLLVCR